MSSTTPCSCSASPCACSCSCSSASGGCLGDWCVSRPRYFAGQLITADDLNASEAFVRARTSLLARIGVGWGVLGGMRVTAAPGQPFSPIPVRSAGGSAPLTPNPQIVAGSLAMVGSGAAIDAAGRPLVLCSPRVVDLMALPRDGQAPTETRSCEGWFPDVDCGSAAGVGIVGQRFYLVAELSERPERPVAQYAGGGPCDDAPSCQYSRTAEVVNLRLVPSLPPDYTIIGCLEASGLMGPEPPAVPSDAGEQQKIYARMAYLDRVGELMMGFCCQRPAVVLGMVIFTSSAAGLGPGLPAAPVYTLIYDAYPMRRVVRSAAEITQGVIELEVAP